MQLKVVSARGEHELAVLEVEETLTIKELKQRFHNEKPKYSIHRQSFRSEPRGKLLPDEETLRNAGLAKLGKVYFKDLGPQIGWSTVFLCEYAGPLLIYILFYLRPDCIYGAKAATKPYHFVVRYAAVCWVAHYAKRILETIFVHRFSHSTMPLRNLFKNSGYYWGFAAFVAYYVNHPFYTPAYYGNAQIYTGLLLFVINELGNLGIHWHFRTLRPAGSTQRQIPRFCAANPSTLLFNWVSCPNYTYETGAWLAFSVMTQCLPALLFTAAGFYQMMLWAIGKHKRYTREFKDYPRSRRAILPFLI